MSLGNAITKNMLDMLDVKRKMYEMAEVKAKMHKAFVVDDQWGCQVGDTIPIVASFDTADEAAIYISGLEDYETGRYGISGPAE